MSATHSPVGQCECGRAIEFQKPAGSGTHREVACECGRRHDVEYGVRGWVAVAQLTPEGSLPLSGFSIPLRQTEVSRSEARAEVKAADMKVFAVQGVRLPTDARRRWISWWREHRPSMGAFFPPPRRIGRLPVPRAARRVPAARAH